MSGRPRVRVMPPGAQLFDDMPIAALRPGDVWEQIDDEVVITEVGAPEWDDEIGKAMVTFHGWIRKGWGRSQTIRTWSFPVEQTFTVYREQQP